MTAGRRFGQRAADEGGIEGHGTREEQTHDERADRTRAGQRLRNAHGVHGGEGDDRARASGRAGAGHRPTLALLYKTLHDALGFRIETVAIAIGKLRQ
jgi:hypothetical protein